MDGLISQPPCSPPYCTTRQHHTPLLARTSARAPAAAPQQSGKVAECQRHMKHQFDKRQRVRAPPFTGLDWVRVRRTIRKPQTALLLVHANTDHRSAGATCCVWATSVVAVVTEACTTVCRQARQFSAGCLKVVFVVLRELSKLCASQ